MDGLILCSYGDVLRVPGSQGQSLLRAKAEGADVRVVYSVLHALRIARENPSRPVVFFAIGFGTPTPPTPPPRLPPRARRPPALPPLRSARETPSRPVVFFAIGFETTTPPTAHAVLRAQALGLSNFAVFCNHVLTPAAIQNI